VFTGKVDNELSLYSLQITAGVHIHDPYFMGKVIHSCDPNMSCDMKTFTFTAIKDIYQGDFLTMDYETTEDILYRSFVCNCGSKNCRRLIRGKSFSVHDN
jgi:hypothetical protein